MSLYLDSFSGSYEQKVTQLIQRCKQMTVSGKDISDMSLGNSQDAVHYDYTASLTKKRIDATIAYHNLARKKLVGAAMPAEIDELFAYSNSLILRGGYTNADIYTSVVIASAIWILDPLNIQGKPEEAYPYLPTVDDEDILLSVRHPQYDSTLIDSVIKLIFMRNRKCYEPMLIIEDPRVLLSERVESDPRKAYDAVISLIDPKAIQAVKEKFERKVWEFYRLSFSAYAALQKEQDRIEKEIDELQRKTLSSAPIIYGGGQESTFRSGTENLIGIAGFGAAAERGMKNISADVTKLKELRAYAISQLETLNITLNIPKGECAPHIINITLPSIKSETMLHHLSANGIYVSSGSACSSNSSAKRVSRALRGFGLSDFDADCSMRISLSHYNTKEEIDLLVSAIKDGIDKLVKINKR